MGPTYIPGIAHFGALSDATDRANVLRGEALLVTLYDHLRAREFDLERRGRADGVLVVVRVL